MTTDSLDVMNGQGHLHLEWDPDDDAQVAEVRAEVERLRAAGYSFFMVNDGPADAVAAGRGALDVRRIEDPTELANPMLAEAMSQEEGISWLDDPEPQSDHRRSEWKAWRRRNDARARGETTVMPGRRTVAVAPMRGG